MKTPREILLERHQAASPELDAIRHKIVGQASSLSQSCKKEGTETSRMPVLLLIWHELIWPSRRIWAGLATAWVLILAVNFSLRDRSPADAMTSVTPQMMLTFRQQQQLLTELLGPDEPRAAKPTVPFEPRPRSEGRIEILVT